MAAKISLYDRLKNKIRNLLYKIVLKKFDFGSRVSKNTWEAQFENGEWLYLKSEDEAEHYKCIVEMYKKFTDKGSILDIGCGQAVLYNYFLNANLQPDYLGIDISSKAIHDAIDLFPTAKFKQLDFDKAVLEQRFDVLIFNETLYYFNKPLIKIKETIKDNLNRNGYLIVSMCESIGHDLIWKRLEENYKVLETKEIENKKNQKWRVSIFKSLTLFSSLLLICSKQGQAISEIGGMFCLV